MTGSKGSIGIFPSAIVAKEGQVYAYWVLVPFRLKNPWHFGMSPETPIVVEGNLPINDFGGLQNIHDPVHSSGHRACGCPSDPGWAGFRV